MSTASARASREETVRPFPSEVGRPERILPRAVFARIVAATKHDDPIAVAGRFWPRDRGTLALLERAAVPPAETATAGWADALAAQAMGAFLGSLQPNAGAALLQAGTLYDLTGRVKINLPRANTTGTAHWVAEGAPIPVGQGHTQTIPLGPPCKLAIIETLTRELAEQGAESGVQIVSQIISDAARLALDQSLFSANASSASSPAGILNGLTATTATAAASGMLAAMGDARALVDAIVAAGGGQRILFFASPGRALALKAYMPDIEVYGAAAIPSTELIACDAAAFASGFGAAPEIMASLEAVLHYEDTAPAAIGTPGSPNVVAAPAQSVFQYEIIALRLILKAAWCLRVPGAAAFISTGMVW
jgi:hypothetical protein